MTQTMTRMKLAEVRRPDWYWLESGDSPLDGPPIWVMVEVVHNAAGVCCEVVRTPRCAVELRPLCSMRPADIYGPIPSPETLAALQEAADGSA